MEPELAKRGWGKTQWVIAIVVGLLAVSLIVPTLNTVGDTSNQVRATSNCRQIISALQLYASDHGGAYPKGPTANAVFRQLFREGIVQHEGIFGCPISPFNGDNNVGKAPGYSEAVAPNENHWMMVAGQNEDSTSSLPLVFENALSTTLPLKWDTANAGKPVRGRTWIRGKIVVGMNDNSVSVVKLSESATPILNLPPGTRILDIETAP